jgi:large subunit ribosomal protein L18
MLVKRDRYNPQKWRRKKRIRAKISGTSEIPRMTVYCSNQHISAQIVDDQNGNTIASASSMEKDIEKKSGGVNIELAKQIGKLVGERAKSKQIEKIVFDRNGRLYHGRVKALADAAREAGLKF